MLTLAEELSVVKPIARTGDYYPRFQWSGIHATDKILQTDLQSVRDLLGVYKSACELMHSAVAGEATAEVTDTLLQLGPQHFEVTPEIFLESLRKNSDRWQLDWSKFDKQGAANCLDIAGYSGAMDGLLSEPLLGTYEPPTEESLDVYGFQEAVQFPSAAAATEEELGADRLRIPGGDVRGKVARPALKELASRLKVKHNDTVLIIREGVIPGFYDTSYFDVVTADLAAKVCTELGASVSVLTLPVGAETEACSDRTTVDALSSAVKTADHTLFFSRLGQQVTAEAWWAGSLARRRRRRPNGCTTTLFDRHERADGKLSFTARWSVAEPPPPRS